MPTSTSVRATMPPTVWLARGRHVGPAPRDALLRRLRQLKDSGTIDDYRDPSEAEDAGDSGSSGDLGELVLEARWRVAETVTVRARLTLAPASDDGQEWVLAAEAERPWDQRWPSPATMFWPEEPDADWDHDAATGLRLGDVNRLPSDDKAMRRVLRDAVRGSWAVNVVVHEAMTPDERGLLPLARLLPVSLRHRVVEHRAAPHQLRAVNWALRGIGVEVPRGGAIVLPGHPAPPEYTGDDFSVRTVFLDGSEPSELIEALTRYVASPRPFPDGAEDAVTALREQWRLLTLEEELARERALVAMYAEALEAMTKSRDLYREAAEAAHEALAAYRENAASIPVQSQPPVGHPASPLQQLSRTLDRLRGTAKALRPTPGPREEGDADGGADRSDR
ncbi:hypothetical protein CLM62_42065 [Streptomyces sp. SA15]|uniref:hypothetical protein n=1 Tax=Streptomyces sp. SA15 TaxID=934019 RepID=UPI000BB078E7|nr:hypothetical protein [Streptomyces sp. SA15]PAZ10048.1 hypothetical protein CLM62_42065 [Streptomyces sp. SA15]